MRSIFTLTLAVTVASSVLARNTMVVYQDPSPGYDISSTPVSSVTCAAQLDPPYTTFGEIPAFPYLAGASFIADSKGGTTACGTCWQLTSANGTINVLVINHAGNLGFEVGHTAFNDLTDHGAFLHSSVNATLTEVDTSVCGL